MTSSQAFLQIYTFKVFLSVTWPQKRAVHNKEKPSLTLIPEAVYRRKGRGGRQFTTTEMEEWNKNIFQSSAWKKFNVHFVPMGNM